MVRPDRRPAPGPRLSSAGANEAGRTPERRVRRQAAPAVRPMPRAAGVAAILCPAVAGSPAPDDGSLGRAGKPAAAGRATARPPGAHGPGRRRRLAARRPGRRAAPRAGSAGGAPGAPAAVAAAAAGEGPPRPARLAAGPPAALVRRVPVGPRRRRDRRHPRGAGDRLSVAAAAGDLSALRRRVRDHAQTVAQVHDRVRGRSEPSAGRTWLEALEGTDAEHERAGRHPGDRGRQPSRTRRGADRQAARSRRSRTRSGRSAPAARAMAAGSGWRRCETSCRGCPRR